MNLIKNETPYLGKIKLKFEKFPYYTSGTDGHLNKVHLNLGFIKLVSRMVPDETKEGQSNVDPNKVALIEHFTGGKVTKYEWWDVKNPKGEVFKSTREPKHKKDILFHGALENSFVSKSGEYIGDINRGWWYYKNLLMVCEEYPHGVAARIDVDSATGEVYVSGYCGYTHRGACVFKIGDRLFDPAYVPVPEDYTQKEWAKWEAKYNKALNKAIKKDDKFDINCIQEDGIGGHIPFTLRGKKTIETLEEALQAAINMSKYLS